MSWLSPSGSRARLPHASAIALSLLLFGSVVCRAEISSNSAVIFLDFNHATRAADVEPDIRVLTNSRGSALEFVRADQFLRFGFSNRLDGVQAASVGGWFFLKNPGEQVFFSRGLPESGPNGERMFPPRADWVDFLIGTDQRGFFLGALNGNGSMPFPQVTLDEPGIDEWHQLVVVKTARGFSKLFHNGLLVRSDEHAVAAGKIWPFRDVAAGEPLRLGGARGAMAGEAWVFARELTADEIAADFARKRDRYKPALPPVVPALREMNLHPAAGLWREAPSRKNWARQRATIQRAAMEILGDFPAAKVPLDPRVLDETDCGSYIRRKVSIQVQPGDRMPAWLLIPKKLRGRVPAIICFYGTSSGAGKDTTVGLSGRVPGTPPHRNEGFAVDMVEAGFVALAPDYLRDGERIRPGRRPYDTTDFYEQFPNWSIHGKDIWDTSRAIDYLETLRFVDRDRIGMTGHSYGGHSTIFCAAMEPRIKVAVANGPVSDFLHHGLHWAVPKGGANSQSMPALRPFVLDHTLPLPITFYEFTSLIAPRPLLVGQAVGEHRPREEENYAAVKEVYAALGFGDRVRYHWYAGDHDFPPEARAAAVAWFRRWLAK